MHGEQDETTLSFMLPIDLNQYMWDTLVLNGSVTFLYEL